MRTKHRLAILGAAALTAWGALASAAASSAVIGEAALTGSDGAAKGQVRLVETSAGIELRLTVSGLSAGSHGVHLHAVGSCSAPDFASAGPHLNPGGHMHGTLNPQGSHLGDLPTSKSRQTARVR
jgi:Cu-Zn family superoxide dismutase